MTDTLEIIKLIVAILTIYFGINGILNGAKSLAFRKDKIKKYSHMIDMFINVVIVIMLSNIPQIISMNDNAYNIFTNVVVGITVLIPLISYFILRKYYKNNINK